MKFSLSSRLPMKPTRGRCEVAAAQCEYHGHAYDHMMYGDCMK